jgi:hypothetical protein
MTVELNKETVVLDINIWDDFEDNENKIYQNKLYKTYAYIESSSIPLSKEIELFILQQLKEHLVKNQVLLDSDMFIHYFIAGSESNNQSGKSGLLSKFFNLIINDQLVMRSEKREQSIFHYKRYELCFKHLTHNQLDEQILPFLQSSNLDFIKDDVHFHLNIYSES